MQTTLPRFLLVSDPGRRVSPCPGRKLSPAQESTSQPAEPESIIHPERLVFERMSIFGQDRLYDLFQAEQNPQVACALLGV
jgi:hypothetical protein